jgi:hypothetical protein
MRGKIHFLFTSYDTSSDISTSQDCGKGLTGEKEARQHAAETGHVRLSEY